MGSAALQQLARRGARVLGIDRYRPPHALGSTHGQSRIIREAYFEHPLYVPLVRRAYECWAELEEESGARVYRRTGGLMLGWPDGPVVSGSLASAAEHGIAHRLLDAEEVRREFPGFHPPDEYAGLWEDRAGLLFPETAVGAQLTLAERHGATIWTDTPIFRWEAGPSGVRVETAEGWTAASHLVLSLGAWIGPLLRSPQAVFQVERQLFHWFRPVTDSSHWPVALWEHHRGGLFATLPEAPDRVKVGVHHEGEIVDPETVSRVTSPEEDARVQRLVARFQPGAAGPLSGSAVCLYTNTADGHFVVDRHWDHENVFVVSPCSGHGFKFSSAIGEAVADLVTRGVSRFDLAPFSIHRFVGRLS